MAKIMDVYESQRLLSRIFGNAELEFDPAVQEGFVLPTVQASAPGKVEISSPKEFSMAANGAEYFSICTQVLPEVEVTVSFDVVSKDEIE